MNVISSNRLLTMHFQRSCNIINHDNLIFFWSRRKSFLLDNIRGNRFKWFSAVILLVGSGTRIIMIDIFVRVTVQFLEIQNQYTAILAMLTSNLLQTFQLWIWILRRYTYILSITSKLCNIIRIFLVLS